MKPPAFKQVYPDITEGDILAHGHKCSPHMGSWLLLHKFMHSKSCTPHDLRVMLTMEANRRRLTSAGSYPRMDVMRRIITRLAKIESIRLRKLLGMGGIG